jgi:hypothetical protein
VTHSTKFAHLCYLNVQLLHVTLLNYCDGKTCYSASSERKLLLHKLKCMFYVAVVIALYRAIRVVCLHDVSMIVIGVEGAHQAEEKPSHHYVAPGMSLPHEPSHTRLGYSIAVRQALQLAASLFYRAVGVV